MRASPEEEGGPNPQDLQDPADGDVPDADTGRLRRIVADTHAALTYLLELVGDVAQSVI